MFEGVSAMVLRLITGLLGLAFILLAIAAILSPGFRSDVRVVAGDMSGALPLPSGTSSPWDDAIETQSGGRIGVVTGTALNVRSAPSVDATTVGSLFQRHLIEVQETVEGDAVDGETDWYRIGESQFVSAAFIEPFEPREPDSGRDGHWIDVDLSNHYAVAYDGGTPVFAAILLTGRAGWDTPEGEFEIFRRVESETMDAGTIGIPEDAPNYYYLDDVPYTQYFAEGGYAIHGNDWSPPEAFGRAGSHGCINMQLADAKFFWDFLDYGDSLVISH
jgi:hypothetical protein